MNVATSCGIHLSPTEDKRLEVVSTLIAQERAQAIPTEVKL
jgi:hypothetical protein